MTQKGRVNKNRKKVKKIAVKKNKDPDSVRKITHTYGGGVTVVTYKKMGIKRRVNKMTAEVEKQIHLVLRRQKKLAMLATDPMERAQVYGMWAGFLGGMKLSGNITNIEYNQLYDEMINSQSRKLLA